MAVQYANKGKQFESAIEYSLRVYARRGIAYGFKVPEAVRRVRRSRPGETDQEARYFRQASPADFVGAFLGIPFAMDAKECAGPRLAKAAVTDKQLETMLGMDGPGRGVGLLLVSLGWQRPVLGVHVGWWAKETARRSSVRVDRMLEAAQDPKAPVALLEPEPGIVVPFGQAITKIREVAHGRP